MCLNVKHLLLCRCDRIVGCAVPLTTSGEMQRLCLKGCLENPSDCTNRKEWIFRSYSMVRCNHCEKVENEYED